ncbi:MAG: MarR family transcriptional regulator [Pseudomonadota bacterium]
MTDPDFLQDLGVSALGTRLRRLFEMLNGPVSDAYRSELGFEQRWFALTLLLAERGELGVQQAADALGTSHVAVLQVAKAMETRGLLKRRKSSADKRVVLLALTSTGCDMAKQVTSLSQRVDAAASALLAEAAPRFLAGLTGLEDALRAAPFDQRLDAARDPPED